ncbi:uncharacterized protein LOC129285142 isoform X2 [Prosopis cineraria]|uniref:uncharacterized protein LOC129285142 isoform X2 n=1 Tax=Prosopis cineraria TaxID=364024 RepID=UPI00240FAC59|nr:uncharacterized protein LOC129285142 isoform X2 [Prosopis cineraria]
MSTNGHAILKTHEGSLMTQGHVHLYHIVRTFEGAEDLKRLQIRNFHELDWNDVEIQVTCLTPNMPVVRCGVYVYTQHSNMENLRFKSSQLSMNAPTSSLKRRANASNEPPSKFLKKFNNSMKGTRRVKRHRIFLSCRKRKIVFPVALHR